jgi:hypothetical protein
MTNDRSMMDYYSADEQDQIDRPFVSPREYFQDKKKNRNWFEKYKDREYEDRRQLSIEQHYDKMSERERKQKWDKADRSWKRKMDRQDSRRKAMGMLFGGKGKLLAWLVYAIVMVCFFFFLRNLFYACLASTVIVVITIVILNSRDISWKARGGVTFVAILIIGLVLYPTLMSTSPLNMSDVQPYNAGFRYNRMFYNGDNLGEVYYNRLDGSDGFLIDGQTTTTLGVFSQINDRIMEWDYGNQNLEEPDVRVEFNRDTVPCTVDGIEVDEYKTATQYYDYTDNQGDTYKLKFYKTYVMSEITITFDGKEDWETAYSAARAVTYFKWFFGELDFSYTSYPDGSPQQLFTAHAGGTGMKGEIAFGIHAEKIRYNDEEALDDYSELVSSAIIDVECRERSYEWHTNGWKNDNPMTYTSAPSYGKYHVMTDIVDCLYYDNVDAALQNIDPMPSENWFDLTYSDNMRSTVYVPIDFDVYLGATCGGATDLTRAKNLEYVDVFTTKLKFVSTVISTYQLDIDVDGRMITSGDDDGNDLTGWEKFLEWLTNMYGGLQSFWYGGAGGKTVIILVSLVLVGILTFLLYTKARFSGGQQGRVMGGGLLRPQRQQQPTININVGGSTKPKPQSQTPRATSTKRKTPTRKKSTIRKHGKKKSSPRKSSYKKPISKGKQKSDGFWKWLVKGQPKKKKRRR